MEPKFRIWIKAENRMLGPDEIARLHFNKGQLYGILTWNDSIYLLSEFILMASTGLLDKNGKEIFEGDILRDAEGNISIVVWDKDDVKFENIDRDEYEGFLDGNYAEPAYTADGVWVSQDIAGNIHESPELLNV